MIATRFDSCSDHTSCFWGCFREIDLKDNQLVLCRLDPSVSPRSSLEDGELMNSLTVAYVVIGLVFGKL